MALSKEEKDRISKAIKGYKARKIAIQVPEGMKTKVQSISEDIEKLGVQTVIFSDPCFGACDIPDNKAKELGCDMIIHFGHSDFGLKTKIPVLYLEHFIESDPVKILSKNELKYNNIGLLTTIQYIKSLENVRKYLEKKGKKVFVGGQILGCQFDNAKKIENKVDCFLFIGSGRFHALGVLAITNKPVIQCDIEKDIVVDLSNEKADIEKRRVLKQMKFKDSKKVGLLVSTKKGQMKRDVFKIKQKIEAKGKKVWILVMDYISPEKLLGMDFDILVNTACPRIQDDLVFKVPIIDLKDIVLVNNYSNNSSRS